MSLRSRNVLKLSNWRAIRFVVRRNALLCCMMIFSCETAYACTCSQISHRVEFRESAAVFAGTVLEVNEDASYISPKLNVSPAIQKILDSTKRYIVRVRIERSFKGVAGKEVVLYSFQGSTCTGLMFMRGEKYLIYADRKDGRLSDGGLCSRTAKLDKTSKEYRELQRLSLKWSRN